MSKPTGTMVLLNNDPYGVSNEFDLPARVVDTLSVQFSAMYQDGTSTMTYLFYKDEGATWINGDRA